MKYSIETFLTERDTNNKIKNTFDQHEIVEIEVYSGKKVDIKEGQQHYELTVSKEFPPLKGRIDELYRYSANDIAVILDCSENYTRKLVTIKTSRVKSIKKVE